MRKDVRHGQFRTPARLVAVEAVFLKPAEVENTEVAARRRNLQFAQRIKLLLHRRLLGRI